MDNRLTTETRNPRSLEIDAMEPLEIVRLMNDEDRKVVEAVSKAAPEIARGIDMMTETLRSGRKVYYVGAGTSGRLGLLDAVELLPTFGVGEESVRTILAGGEAAIYKAVEGAEDDEEQGQREVERQVEKGDLVLGIAASGGTPFVLGSLKAARRVGASSIGITCNADSAVEKLADLTITVVVGPEVIAGSTRLKAGTAQKMVLNMLSTGAMVRWGKVYQNLMVDLQATNRKLRERSRRIVVEVTGATDDQALDALTRADGELKTAIVMLKMGVPAGKARRLLEASKGSIRQALQNFSHD